MLVASDVNMWMTVSFPAWVLVVSLVMLVRSGVIDLPGDERISPGPDSGPAPGTT